MTDCEARAPGGADAFIGWVLQGVGAAQKWPHCVVALGAAAEVLGCSSGVGFSWVLLSASHASAAAGIRVHNTATPAALSHQQ